MRKYLILFLGILAISSCMQRRPHYRMGGESFIGMTERELVGTIGAPDSVYEIENEKFLTYFKTGGGYGNMQICKITFVFYKERLDNWHYEGNMCDAYIDSIDLH